MTGDQVHHAGYLCCDFSCEAGRARPGDSTTPLEKKQRKNTEMLLRLLESTLFQSATS